ncbi:hypothetical protein DRN72_01365 [Methanosarcinales archaeon]|nr:MAG: hypothetical protein DRN72_01365 [Methanosarcinales archaeon]
MYGSKLLTTMLILLVMIPVCYASYIPQSFSLSDNYYTVYGGPELDAVIAGESEFERGDDVYLLIDIYNYGKILGFDSDKTPSNANEIALAQIEKNYEEGVTTAIGILATLENPYDAPFDIKSPTQSVGSLRGGEKTHAPVEFELKVYEDAPAGEYTLILNLTYEYQKNVEISGTPNMPEVNFWYDDEVTYIPIKVKVKKEPLFEVVSVDCDLYPGKKSIIEVVYKNVGEETAREAIARVSVVDPFSSIDDQAYLGDIEPNGTATAIFKLKVDSDAVAKPYAIDSEIKYKDEIGDTKISDIIKIPVEVKQSEGGIIPIEKIVVVIGIVIGIIIGRYFFKRKFDMGKR